ncbi:MAG: thioredoxin domain-containing protein, partial [Vicinamibacterales bacterium]
MCIRDRDAEWRVPHFEKMLYDQAQLVLAYVEAARLSDDRYFADVAADTLAYVERDLGDPEGGFYSAEDADSVPPEQAGEAHAHKSEGAFYIWTDEEIREVAGADAEPFMLRFGALPGGNAPSDPQGEFTGRNLLYTARAVEDIASETGRTSADVESALERAGVALLERRASRPRPHLDDKILTAWNGLMIAAFARAGRLLDDGQRYVGVARRAATFLRTRLWQADRQILLRRYRHGHAAVDGYAEDYAYLIFGLIELFQADGDAEWLEWALTLQRRQDALFWDAGEGGWFSTTGRDPSVLLRLKEDYDGAEPAASSIGVLNLLALSHLTAEPEMTLRIKTVFTLFAARAEQAGRSVPMMLAALSTYHSGMPQIVLAGEPHDGDREQLAAVVRRHYLPGALTIPLTAFNRDSLAGMLPWTEAMQPLDGRATAYVCREFACLEPARSPEELDERLAGL